MDCPFCGLTNPDSALRCDCGYEFVAGSTPKAALCGKCGAAMTEAVKFCGGCGAPRGLPWPKPASKPESKGLGRALAILTVLGLFVFYLSLKRAPVVEPSARPIAREPAPPAQKEPSECLVPSGVKGTRNESSIKITGMVTNTCGRDFRYVSISFRVLDDSGTLLGQAFTNLAGLRTGDKWKFEAHGFHPGSRYELDKVTAY